MTATRDDIVFFFSIVLFFSIMGAMLIIGVSLIAMLIWNAEDKILAAIEKRDVVRDLTPPNSTP